MHWSAKVNFFAEALGTERSPPVDGIRWSDLCGKENCEADPNPKDQAFPGVRSFWAVSETGARQV